VSNDDDDTSKASTRGRRSVAVPMRAAVGIAVAIVVLVAVLLVVVMGGGGDGHGNSGSDLNPLQARARELRAKKQKLVDGKVFLPPSRSIILVVLERQGPGAIDRASARINRYSQLPDVPRADLFGAPTGDEPGQWFNVVYCDNGDLPLQA